MIPVVGLIAVIDGFASIARFTVNRRLSLGRLTVFDLFAQVVSTIVAILWAYFEQSVWALVAGAITATTLRTVLSYRLIADSRHHFEWDSDSARSIIRFGRWIFLASAFGFLASHVDRLILGKLIPLEVFGVYTIAFMLSSLPERVVSQLSLKVIFPAAAERAHLPREDLRQVVVKNRRPLLFLLAIAVALLAGFGDQVVLLLYDPRYSGASWMLSILALGLWPMMLTNSVGAMLLAIGEPRYLAFSGISRFVLLLVALPLAHLQFGLVGVVCAIALGGLSDYLVESYGLWRNDLLVLRQDLEMTIVWLLSLAGILAIRYAVGLPLPFLPAS